VDFLGCQTLSTGSRNRPQTLADEVLKTADRAKMVLAPDKYSHSKPISFIIMFSSRRVDARNGVEVVAGNHSRAPKTWCAQTSQQYRAAMRAL